MQLLWKKYVQVDGAEISNYLQQLKEQDTDQKVSKVLVADIRHISDQVHFEILPTELLAR